MGVLEVRIDYFWKRGLKWKFFFGQLNWLVCIVYVLHDGVLASKGF